MRIAGVFEGQGNEYDYMTVDFSLVTKGGIHHIKNAIAVNNLRLHKQSIPTELAKERLVRALKLSMYSDAIPKLLIGQDNCELIETIETHRLNEGNLLASRSRLGWSIHGPAHRQSRGTAETASKVATAFYSKIEGIESEAETSDRQLHDLVKEYFSMDNSGLATIESEDPAIMLAQRQLEGTTRRIDQGWETGLLWSSDEVLPESREMTLRRLHALERRLDKDPRYAEAYYAEFNRFIEKGYIIERGDRENSARTWYLPHFCVFNPNRPGKTRLVFDAAARSHGHCLNDFLLPGPVLLPSMIGVIMRHRQGKVGVKGDIKDMFLQVHMREADLCAQRLLSRGRRRTGDPVEYVVTRLMFGSRPSPSSAIYVRNRNAREHPNVDPEEIRSIERNSFVDDYFESRNTIEEVNRMARRVAEINANGGFIMHEWASNEEDALKGIPESTRAAGEVSFDSNKSAGKIEKALGLRWDTGKDELKFNVALKKIPAELITGAKIPTKRQVLGVVMSVFDPLGLLTPFTVRAKIIMREIWRSGIGWDEAIRDSERVIWSKWLADLPYIGQLSVPRHYLKGHPAVSDIELHTFCDASTVAYAAVCYWRARISDGEVITSLVASKGRVAPLKNITIPRLELQAAVLGAQLARCVEQEHDFQPKRRVYWSDSRTVLCWLRSGTKKYLPFVANRVGKISRLSEIGDWRWVPTGENPADMATRDEAAAKTFDKRWFHGPRFLNLGYNEWPREASLDTSRGTSANEELAKVQVYSIRTHVPNLSQLLPDAQRFSSWNRLLRSTAFILFVAGERWKGDKKAHITVDNLRAAEKLWMQRAQLDDFADEICALTNGKNIPKRSSLLPLCPFIDSQGIVRMNSRLHDDATVPIETKPIIIDGRHRIARLMIAWYHARANHGTHAAVLNEVRQRAWVIGLRRALRSVVAKCQFCIVRRARPTTPLMGNLPSARIAYQRRAFHHCGLDYFGPMMVRIGRRREKRWGALFTCLTTRAVHIELVHSLTTDSAIMAVRRMSARRGQPEFLYSDNGTNFRGASRELKELVEKLDRDAQQEYALERRMSWLFIPPAAPHMGGAWERMVRTIKTALGKVLHEQAPREETLITLLAEVEHIVNSRPLTQVSMEPGDEEALTPNHFLLGSPSGRTVFDRYRDYSKCTRREWEISQTLANSFWERWLKEYLPTMMPRSKWNEDLPSLEVGDVVLIADYQARNTWRRGIIERVFPGPDDKVRVVEVRTKNGTVKRPASKVVRLTSSSPGAKQVNFARGEECKIYESPASRNHVSVVNLCWSERWIEKEE